jgi:formylmethanofuran dehydrogenase subunit E
MKLLEQYIAEAAKDGETRSGMILGIRIAMAGLQHLAIPDPGVRRHEFIIAVETDRCLPDAIELVTGCRLGNRTLKFHDMGKMAAVFMDLQNDRAVRVAGRENVNQRALEYFPNIDEEEARRRTYMRLPENELLDVQMVNMTIPEADRPGYHAARVQCAACGEGISFSRETVRDGRVLCRSCAGHSYYSR